MGNFRVKDYNEKVSSLGKKVSKLRGKTKEDILSDGVKSDLTDIISIANSILMHIRHEERRQSDKKEMLK